MRKPLVILIIVILSLSFVWLVYYGIRHSRGVPVKFEEIARPIIEAPFMDKTLDLSQGISAEFWDALKPQEVDLTYQVTVLPWPKPRDQIQPVRVKVFHNAVDIYFYLSWNDDNEDRVLEINKFSDASAIMFPLDEKAQAHSIMMGFLGKANIWQWKASQDREYWQSVHPETDAYADYHYPFEEKEIFPVAKTMPKSAVNDLLAIRIGTITPKEIQSVEARGFWQEGKWQVVFKRTLKALDPEADAQFNPGKKLCAFAVWDGASGDRGGRKSISDWAELIVH